MGGYYYFYTEDGKKKGEYANLGYARASAMNEIIASKFELPIGVFCVNSSGAHLVGTVSKVGKGFRWSAANDRNEINVPLKVDGGLKKTKRTRTNAFGLDLNLR